MKKKRIKIPDPGPAPLQNGKPWILSKNIISGKCKCINSDKVIPNVAAWFLFGYFKTRNECQGRVANCNRIQV